MTSEELLAIIERAQAATPGPWRWADWSRDERFPDIPEDLENGHVVLESESPGERTTDVLPWEGDSPWHPGFIDDAKANYRANAEFIAHSRADIDALIFEVGRLQGENARFRNLIERLAAEFPDYLRKVELHLEARRLLGWDDPE